MYQTPFRIDPSYNEEKVVFITPDVAETYAPVKINVADSGSAGSGTPRPDPSYKWVTQDCTPRYVYFRYSDG
jgi:hypothetical protein